MISESPIALRGIDPLFVEPSNFCNFRILMLASTV